MEQSRQEFARFVAPGSGELAGNLDHAALLIAATIDPSVVIQDQLLRLDELAASFEASSGAQVSLALFGGAEWDASRHFCGNQNDYYDPDNSMLNRVLDRRIGIPISLSILLIEVARRKHVVLDGVGMPGHFLVRSEDGYFDPFHRGVLIDESGCERLYRRMAGADVQLPTGALDPTPPAAIVRRMLLNLSAIAATQSSRPMLRSTRSLLAAYPDATHGDHVQHAYAAAEIGQFSEAAAAGELAMPLLPGNLRDKLDRQITMWRARLN